jgi:hypothetical protein
VKLNNREVGAKWFGEYAQWDSDKTAKTGFVGFGSTYLGDYQDFLAEYFSVLPGEGAFIEGLFFPDGAIVVAIGPKWGCALRNHWMTPVRVGVMSGNLSKAVIKGLGVEGWGSRLSPQNSHSVLGRLTCHINMSDATMNEAFSKATKAASPEKLMSLAVTHEGRFGSNAAACAFAFKASSTLT